MIKTTPLVVDGDTKYTNLVELEHAAEKHLTANAYGYYAGGAEVSPIPPIPRPPQGTLSAVAPVHVTAHNFFIM